MNGGPTETRERWSASDAGERYARARWRSSRRRLRDPRKIEGLLRRHGQDLEAAWILDAPCGAGRLRESLTGIGRRLVGLDVSLPMLAATGEPAAALLNGDAEHLPFRDGSFGAVVCCRLLHHLREPAALEATVRELVRVSSDLVVATFWDAGTLAEWGRRVRPRSRPRGRLARTKAELARCFERAGAPVLGFDHSMRYLSRQTYLVARKHGSDHGDS